MTASGSDDELDTGGFGFEQGTAVAGADDGSGGWEKRAVDVDGDEFDRSHWL
jgi:hypothetical protein